MKKILLFTFLISFFGFSQNLDSIKYELKKVDTLKEDNKKEKKLLNIIDSLIIKNNKLIFKDTLNMDYRLHIDKKGIIYVMYNKINDKNASKTFEYIFSKKYQIKPFKDALKNNKKYSTTLINRYLKKDNIYIPFTPKKNPFCLIKDIKKVQIVPKYKGCHGTTNKALTICLNKKIRKHIWKKFNVNTAQNLGLSGGKKMIFIQFVINKKGGTSNVIVRAPHPKLKDEAIRVINLLPKFKPGKQDNMPVNVRFNLPITFNVEN